MGNEVEQRAKKGVNGHLKVGYVFDLILALLFLIKQLCGLFLMPDYSSIEK